MVVRISNRRKLVLYSWRMSEAVQQFKVQAQHNHTRPDCSFPFWIEGYMMGGKQPPGKAAATPTIGASAKEACEIGAMLLLVEA